MEVSNLFVCLMGMGVTFVGLICLIVLIWIMGLILRGRGDEPKAAEQEQVIAQAAAEPNLGELIAAVSAALAEELGTDVSAIRILSFRRIS